MKTIKAVAVCMLVACGGSKPAPTTPVGGAAPAERPAAVAGEGEPCTKEVALACPDGQTDACLRATEEEPEDESGGTGTAMALDDGDDESGGTGTAMALDEGRMGKLEKAGNHRCVPK